MPPVSRAIPPHTKSATAIDRHVGARVRMQRMLHGMSQTDLGHRAGGVTFQQIQKYENGVNRIGASRLHRISRALGVPIEFFYDGAPEESGAGRTKSRSVGADISSFLATSDAVHLMKAFVQIRDPSIRRHIVDLAEQLARGGKSKPGLRASGSNTAQRSH
jgi:transcriptional regulator with XRE-family HTH domain